MLVLDEGQVVEYDTPQVLLKDDQSMFSELLKDIREKKQRNNWYIDSLDIEKNKLFQILK